MEVNLLAYFNWNDSFLIHIEEIDNQHHGLVNLVNDLHDSMRRGEGHEVLNTILNKLIEYTLVHFEIEENYFKKFGYTNAESHIQEHAAFIQKVNESKLRFENGTLLVSFELLNFLSEWLSTHIKGTDKKYAPFLIKHGLK